MTETVEIKVPSNLKIVKRCHECLIEGHLCGVLNGSEVCLTPLISTQGDFEGFDIECCKFNRSKKIRIEG